MYEAGALRHHAGRNGGGRHPWQVRQALTRDAAATGAAVGSPVVGDHGLGGWTYVGGEGRGAYAPTTGDRM